MAFALGHPSRLASLAPQDEVCKGKPLALDGLPDLHVDASIEHRPGNHARVKFAPFTTRVGACRQISEQRMVEAPPGDRFWQLLEIDADQPGLDARIDHLARQRAGRALP